MPVPWDVLAKLGLYSIIAGVVVWFIKFVTGGVKKSGKVEAERDALVEGSKRRKKAERISTKPHGSRSDWARRK